MKLLLLAFLITTFCLPISVHAQATTFSIESVGSQVGLGNADAKTTVINILRWTLGILTLAAFFFLFVGFADLLISGDSEVVRIRARRIITGAIIGLVVVLLAWAIVLFAARTTANVTEG